MMSLNNPGTHDARGDLQCAGCGYRGDISTFEPTASVFTDVRCPYCGSTNNEHNAEYLRRLQASFKGGSS